MTISAIIGPSPRQGVSSAVRTIAAALSAAALIVVAAKISVPMWPVPMTMQPFAVLVIAGTFSRRVALGAVCTYLAMAMGGLPVLAGTAGLGGPTTGYLLSYMLVAILLPALRLRGVLSRAAGLAAGLLLATVVIYASGVAWLAAFWTPSLAAAVTVGVLPFLLGDAVKLALAFLCLSAIHRHRPAEG